MAIYTYKKGAEAIFDETSLKILKVLIENPKIPYNKSELARQAEVSRHALYKRWDGIEELGIVKKADVEGKQEYYELDSNSDLVDAISKTLVELEVFTS